MIKLKCREATGFTFATVGTEYVGQIAIVTNNPNVIYGGNQLFCFYGDDNQWHTLNVRYFEPVEE